MNTNKVWLVTGASQGLGLSLVKKLLAQGYQVAATTRNTQSFSGELGETSASFLPLEVNLTDDSNVKEAIAKTVAHFGRIDTIVNNAGYGQTGTLEELSDAEAKANFDVNVYGSLNIIRHSMPYLRQQQGGHIFNIASIGGFYGSFAGWGIYCATKFAMAGFTEGLAEEIREFGVQATVVYPGYFRTNFLSKGSLKIAAEPIAAYTAARASENAHVTQIDGQQANDPDKAADVLIAISKEANPPVHLFLGQDAYDNAHKKIALLTKDIEDWKQYTVSTGL